VQGDIVKRGYNIFGAVLDNIYFVLLRSYEEEPTKSV